LSASEAHPPRPVLGVSLKLVSIVLLAGMAACVKHLGTGIPIGQTIFARGVISLLLLALIAWRLQGLKLLLTRNPRAHALRSLSGTVSMFFWFAALSLIPWADFTAISFTAPMFLTVLAMLFLGERIHVYRWSALAIGFAGVLIMIGPHLQFGAGSSAGVAMALAAAVFSALAMMFLRAMSGAGREHAITITFYFSLTSTICGGLTAIAGWTIPTAEQWLFIVMVGVLGVGGQLLMTFSYRYVEASTIAPLDYSNLLIAVAFGYVFFDEIPRISTWVGAPLVIAAGLIILWREYRRTAPAPAEVTVAPG
jgi:drug/metabolite transporter (DMT)-like permease